MFSKDGTQGKQIQREEQRLIALYFSFWFKTTELLGHVPCLYALGFCHMIDRIYALSSVQCVSRFTSILNWCSQCILLYEGRAE